MAPLLLQQPATKSSYRENSDHLVRRMALWDEGNIKELVHEGQTIQDRREKKENFNDETLPKRFATMVFNNNLKGAMSLIVEKGKGGILEMNSEVKSELLAKHPKPEPINPEGLLSGEIPPDTHPIAFANISAEAIRKFALRSQGGAGVSQQEAICGTKWSPHSARVLITSVKR